jgi:hypothetical protein
MTGREDSGGTLPFYYPYLVAVMKIVRGLHYDFITLSSPLIPAIPELRTDFNGVA